MKHVILRFGLILAILLAGCTKPGEDIINVSKMTSTTTSKATEDITIRVRDVKWLKIDGAWQGKPKIRTDLREPFRNYGRSDSIIYTPRDAKAMRAIDRYIKEKPWGNYMN